MRTITVSIKPPADRTELISEHEISEALIQFARLQESRSLPRVGAEELHNGWLAYWHVSEWPKPHED